MAVQALQIPAQRQPVHQRTYEELQRIVDERDLRVFVQSIVSLEDGQTVGYEALARAPIGSTLESAYALFSNASKYGLTDELEYTALTSALYIQHELPKGSFLAINVGPNLFLTKDFLELAHLCSGIAEHIVFELTEHVPFTEITLLERRIRELESIGYRVALDDTGCGFADIEMARVLRPCIVKLCIDLVERLTHNPDERARFKHIAQELKDNNVTLLGEGIESASQIDMLKALGVTLGQGFYFDKPKALALPSD